MAASTNQTEFVVDEERLVLKYRAVILEAGAMVEEFLPHGILIFFGSSAPEELREVALVHDGSALLSKLARGDLLKFSAPQDEDSGNSPFSWYRLTSIGDMANANLDELGHLVVHFDGATEPHLPGTISVEPGLEALPSIGTIFEIYGQQE